MEKSWGTLSLLSECVSEGLSFVMWASVRKRWVQNSMPVSGAHMCFDVEGEVVMRLRVSCSAHCISWLSQRDDEWP